MNTPHKVALVFAIILISLSASAAGVVTGELKRWHTVTITFDGPTTSETATPNPFRDYRLDVTFTKGTRSIKVPGFYAADGDAAETSATGGNKWRVRFCPDETGTWSYAASFRQGTDIAMSTDPNAGTAVSFNGASGTFSIANSDKTGRDHRGKGALKYVGEHYLRFANGEWFIKVGPDSPEGFLANGDFDASTVGTRATFSSHGQHWVSGDPSWKGGKGKNVIGAINYVSSKGMNCFYLMTYSGFGDTKSVWPYLSEDDRFHFDCSKLDQWEIVFSHMDRKGMLVHMVLSETENEAYWEVRDGESFFAKSRKLYYREMIARFGHHVAMVWNLGEENGWSDAKGGTLGVANSDAQRKAFADFIRAMDPYDHPIVVHNLPGQENNLYTPLLNHPSFEGTSFQMSYNNFSMRWTNDKAREWVDKSKNAGKKWVFSVDEPGHENFERSSMYGDDTAGVRPDELDPNHDDARKWSLWGVLMGGGAGHETYFGWAYGPWGGGDGAVSNYAAWDGWWNQCRYAQEFFIKNLPFTQMHHDNALTDSTSDYVYAKRGEIYAIYLRDGGSTNIDLAHTSGTFEVKWYDPRNGGSLQNGTVASITGGGTRSIGQAPNNTTRDWACLVRRINAPVTYTLTVTSGSGDGSYAAGAVVTITADAAPAGKVFDRWTGATVANATASTTTLTMPAANTTVTATHASLPLISSPASATPNPALTGQAVAMSVSASDPAGGTLTYSWNFGDGTTASGASVTKTYAVAGSYSVRVTVSNARGSVFSDVRVSIVDNQAVRVNFQLAGTAVPSGYLADTGLVFGNRGNGQMYGWNVDVSGTARDRNAPSSPDQRFDTLIHLQKPEAPDAIWEIAVANGTYSVRVVCGDPSYIDSVFKLNVEGVLAIDGTPTATTRWFDKTVNVTVTDGRLTLRSASGAANNKICFVELKVTSLVSSRSADDGALDEAPVFGAMTVQALKAKASYVLSHRDSVSLKLLLPKDALNVLDGKTVGIDAGGAVAVFNVDAKGRGSGENGSCRIKSDKRSGGWCVDIVMSGGAWAASWRDGGLEGNKNAGAEIPVTITIGGASYGGVKSVKLISVEAKGGSIR